MATPVSRVVLSKEVGHVAIETLGRTLTAEENGGAGQIQVFEGSPGGLLYGGPILDLDDVFGASADPGDLFGWAMVAGDLNQDDFDDLVIGAPGDELGGSIVIIPGSDLGLDLANATATRFTVAVIAALIVAACGPGDVVADSGSKQDLPAEAEAEDGVVGDPWDCGELGLKCIGALGIGECIDGECQGRLIAQCWSPEYAPTCDAFCEAFDESCVYLGCDGATAWGWMGSQVEADATCGGGDHDTVIPMTVTCDQPLEGLITTMMCCCI